MNVPCYGTKLIQLKCVVSSNTCKAMSSKHFTTQNVRVYDGIMSHNYFAAPGDLMCFFQMRDSMYIKNYCKTSNISRTKYQKLNVPRFVL